ncbi:BAT38-like protein [Mya arenaria]|uniref:BAT38-like protein n=3 Tax=Mya arenaria TaxID=6604 RepID=A0ABY7FF15_MYAAR|nr:BAT38-like protein [Mya arenaria]
MAKAKRLEDPGQNYDEIVVSFGKQGQLFVSKGFLIQTSPVFKAMFQDGNFRESVEGKVNIQDCRRKSFLEFLLCLDPATMKKVDNGNIFHVAELSEKYQVHSLSSKCKAEMMQILESTILNLKEGFDLAQLKNVIMCIKILQLSIKLENKKITERSINVLGCFGSSYYTTQSAEKFENLVHMAVKSPLLEGKPVFVNNMMSDDFSSEGSKLFKLQQRCKRCFEKLPAEIQNKILLVRLRSSEDNVLRKEHLEERAKDPENIE